MLEIKLIELCNFFGEENITQQDVYYSNGCYPIYSGQTEDNGVLGYIETYTHDGEYLTWTTYGSAGAVFYRKGKFTIGRNCAALQIKDKYKNLVNIKFLKILLEETIRKELCPEGGRSQASIGDVKNLKIQINFQLHEQRNLVAKYLLKLRKTQKDLRLKNICLNQIDEIIKNYYEKYNKTGTSLYNLFVIDLGVGFSELDSYNNPGKIPVYTASIDGPKYFVNDNIINKKKLNEKALIWSRKGNAGSIFHHRTNTDFFITDVSGIIKVKEEYKSKFDYDFLKYYLEFSIKKSLKTAADNNAQVNTTSLKNFKLGFPPYLEQKLIGDLIRTYLI